MSVHICWARGVVYRRVMFCPTCDRRRRFACRLEAWYGVESHCTACGDRWCDGEMAPRPFQRGWRKEAVAHARQMWAEALPHREAKRAIREEVRAALSGGVAC